MKRMHPWQKRTWMLTGAWNAMIYCKAAKAAGECRRTTSSGGGFETTMGMTFNRCFQGLPFQVLMMMDGVEEWWRGPESRAVVVTGEDRLGENDGSLGPDD